MLPTTSARRKRISFTKPWPAIFWELGYDVALGAGIPMPLAVAAGIGEMGRNGMVITEKYGSRIHMPDVILTDLPLTADKPIDLAVPDFCSYCRKCAITCPTNSIPFENKVVITVSKNSRSTGLPAIACARMQKSTGKSVSQAPPFALFEARDVVARTGNSHPAYNSRSLRQGAVRPLKWLDDTFRARFQTSASSGWGTTPESRRARKPAQSPAAMRTRTKAR